MLHYRVEIKQAAVRLVLEEHLTYAEVAAKLAIRKFARSKHGFECIDMYRQEGESSFHELIGRPRKCQSSGQGLERMRVENALVKKFHTELRKEVLAKRNIGLSGTTDKNTL